MFPRADEALPAETAPMPGAVGDIEMSDEMFDEPLGGGGDVDGSGRGGIDGGAGVDGGAVLLDDEGCAGAEFLAHLVEDAVDLSEILRVKGGSEKQGKDAEIHTVQ